MRRVPVPAKINLALLVGPRRDDGLHEVTTVLQRIDLCDRLSLEPAAETTVAGFREDTVVGSALAALRDTAGAAHGWSVRLQKRIPVAAGLGGGSADAAVALRLANATLPQPLGPDRLAEIAAGTGADIPFFLARGPQLAEGAGERLRPLDLPQDYWVVVAVPQRAAKVATAAIYERFDELGGGSDYFEERRGDLLAALERVRRPRDFAVFPRNDLAEAVGTGWLADELAAAGAFRADVTGAGPAVYGLFHNRGQARAAARAVRRHGRTWVVAPVW